MWDGGPLFGFDAAAGTLKRRDHERVIEQDRAGRARGYVGPNRSTASPADVLHSPCRATWCVDEP
jgi:hypothetical protein